MSSHVTSNGADPFMHASCQVAPDLPPLLPPCSSTTPPPDKHQRHNATHHSSHTTTNLTTSSPPPKTPSQPPPPASHCLLGWELWPAACLLAQHLATDPNPRDLLPQARAVCELGAGLGLPGIVAALLGARHVALTDLPQALPLCGTQRCGARVQLGAAGLGACISGSGSGCDDAVCSGRKGDTSAEGDGQQEGEGEQHAQRVRQQHAASYDMLLAADVVYVSALAPLLARHPWGVGPKRLGNRGAHRA